MEKASFEKAYAFYRKNNDQVALNVLNKLDQNEPRVMELKAQILYRMEQFEASLELLKKLIRTHSDDQDYLRRANLIAVKTRLQMQNNAQEVELVNLDTFELMYNASCHLIACGRFNEAAIYVDKALVESERALTADGFSKEDKELEMAQILAQKAFVLQKMGSSKEALKIYQQVLKTKDLSRKLKSTIKENLEADYIRFGKNWRPIKRKSDETMEHDKEIITTTATKKKRKRKPKLPANYDPEMPPDPERWLPRQERTAYRKKLHKKFKDREVGRGTQGTAAASATSPNIDYSSKVPAGSTTTSTPHASPKPTAEGPRQQRPAHTQAKKKKKGGKW